MTAIPAAGVVRPTATQADLGYAAYGRAAWEWWCRRNGVEFVLLDRPVDDETLAGASPLLHRWRAAEQLLAAGPAERQVAVVDADTMIRWDAPDFFALTGGSLAAVQDPGQDWVLRSIRSYQQFFPGVRLDAQEYFNAGFVVVSPRQAHLLTAFLDFYRRNRAALDAVAQLDAGIDQTLFNFVVRQEGEPVRFLPQTFNLGHCMPISLYMLPDSAANEHRRQLLAGILAVPGTFDFLDHSYVWHFNGGPKSARADFMRHTWHAISANYPGVPELD
jgi:hypothetical protein